MDGRASTGRPAPAGPSGGEPGSGASPARIVRDRFITLVRGADHISDDERERVIELGLGALRGDAGLGVA
jgi:hypothetical protein